MSDFISKARVLEFLSDQIGELQREADAADTDQQDNMRFLGMAEGLTRMQSAIERGYFDRARSTPKPHSKVSPRSPGTSWEAAREQNLTKATPLYSAIMLVLGDRGPGPSTDDELRKALTSFLERKGYSPESVTMRRGELRDAGWIIDSGERRPGDSGSPMTVWAVAPPEETP